MIYEKDDVIKIVQMYGSVMYWYQVAESFLKQKENRFTARKAAEECIKEISKLKHVAPGEILDELCTEFRTAEARSKKILEDISE